MRTRRLLAAIIIIAALPASLAFAGGAGGVGFGMQYFDAGLSSADRQAEYVTGFGYGVTWQGQRIGGFGMGILSADGVTAGGVGGMVLGQEWKGGPFTAAISLWTGLGGISLHDVPSRRAYGIVFGEAEAEIGIRPVPFMQVVAYAGFQAWGNFVPGLMFRSAVLTTPVFGFRVSWGAF